MKIVFIMADNFYTDKTDSATMLEATRFGAGGCPSVWATTHPFACFFVKRRPLFHQKEAFSIIAKYNDIGSTFICSFSKMMKCIRKRAHISAKKILSMTTTSGNKLIEPSSDITQKDVSIKKEYSP